MCGGVLFPLAVPARRGRGGGANARHARSLLRSHARTLLRSRPHLAPLAPLARTARAARAARARRSLRSRRARTASLLHCTAPPKPGVISGMSGGATPPQLRQRISQDAAACSHSTMLVHNERVQADTFNVSGAASGAAAAWERAAVLPLRSQQRLRAAPFANTPPRRCSSSPRRTAPRRRRTAGGRRSVRARPARVSSHTSRRARACAPRGGGVGRRRSFVVCVWRSASRAAAGTPRAAPRGRAAAQHASTRSERRRGGRGAHVSRRLKPRMRIPPDAARPD
jgi:hypothetical protein